MAEFDDEIGGDEPDDGHHEATSRFCDALESLVSYHLEEYDLT